MNAQRNVPLTEKKGIRKLRDLLQQFASPETYLFGIRDFAPAFPELSYDALKMLLARAVADGLLTRICSGVYGYPLVRWPGGYVLYHVAARLRADTFCYLSLESALSDWGVISQIPLQWITVMTGGRSGKIVCPSYGTIEFIHTKKKPSALSPELVYDTRCRMWRANAKLALQDMKDTQRSLDLIDWEAIDELV